MNYQCYGYVFATMAEAAALSELIRKEANELYAVTATDKEVTHVFKSKRETT